jgi:hypothetical protein
MVEIEFSEPGDDGPSVAGPTTPGADHRGPGSRDAPERPSTVTRLGRLVPPVLWAAAAACALAAPFRTLYTLTVHEPRSHVLVETLDGWGRFTLHPAIDAPSQHETRYGVIYCVGAGLFALLALGALWPAIAGHNRGRSALQGFGIAAGSAVAAVTGTIVLLFRSIQDMAHAQLAELRSDTPPATAAAFRIDLDLGGVVWFGAASVACALLAGLSLALVPRPVPAPPAPVAPLPDLHPADELLG